MGSAIITYGLQPIRAHIASSFADGEDYTRKKIILDIYLQKNWFIYVYSWSRLNYTFCTRNKILDAFFLFSKYDEAIIELHNIFNIILTMPALNLLGYLVVAKPFNKTGIFAFSQLAGIFCMAMSFLILGNEYSIYSTLLIGIYYGNVLKILIFILVMAGQQKYSSINTSQLLLLLPFVFLPFLNYG